MYQIKRSIASKSQQFLDTYNHSLLIPEKPDVELRSLLSGLLDLGVCYRCKNSTGMDVGFEIVKDGVRGISYSECKYTEQAQTLNYIAKYIANARLKNSALTFFISHKLGENLKRDFLSVETTKRDLRQSTLDQSTETLLKYCEGDVDLTEKDESGNLIYQFDEDEENVSVSPKKPNKEFIINLYSVFYDNQNRNLTIKALNENQNPDGVFVVIETNFIVPKV
jgi:hypothetical protein